MGKNGNQRERSTEQIANVILIACSLEISALFHRIILEIIFKFLNCIKVYVFSKLDYQHCIAGISNHIPKFWSFANVSESPPPIQRLDSHKNKYKMVSTLHISLRPVA